MTHREAILTLDFPLHPDDSCPGRLIHLSSGLAGTVQGPRHQDQYFCTRCRSRVVMCEEVYLFCDRGNSLEAEGPPQTKDAW